MNLLDGARPAIREGESAGFSTDSSDPLGLFAYPGKPAESGVAILQLQYPPSANTYWRRAGHSLYVSERAREYRRHVAEEVAGRLLPKLDGRLFLAVSLFPPDRRRHDVDNRLKPLLDALQSAGVFEDDEQVDDLRVIRRPIIKGGICRVLVGRIQD